MSPVLCCLLTLALLQVPRGAPVDPSAFRFSHEVIEAPPGLSVMMVDMGILSESRPDLGDLRIVDSTNHQVPYLLEPTPEKGTYPLPSPIREEAPQRHSYYRLALPFASLPEWTMLITTPDRVFARSIQLKAKRVRRQARSEEWNVIDTAEWRHTDPETPAPTLAMTVPPYVGTGEFLIDVDEGDNQPLKLEVSQMEMRTYQLRFFYPPGEKLTLLYGQDSLPPPQYDLELLASDLAGQPSQTVHYRRVQPRLDVTLARMFYFLWIVLGVAVVGLVALLVRLLRPVQRDEVH
jgi:hypothetical protein